MAFTFHLFVSGQLGSVTFICYSYGCTRELVTEDITPVNFGIQFFILIFDFLRSLAPRPPPSTLGSGFQGGGGALQWNILRQWTSKLSTPTMKKGVGGRGCAASRKQNSAHGVKYNCEITGVISSLTCLVF